MLWYTHSWYKDMALTVSLLTSLDHLAFIKQLTVWLLVCARLSVGVVKQKFVSPHPSHYLGAWNRLCDHLESLVSCSKCTIVIDLMNNLSGFELFCRSYDSLMDSSKMKSNKVFEVLGFFIGQLYCQDLMSVINYFYQAIPSASSPVWLSSKESLHEWMTEKVNNWTN